MHEEDPHPLLAQLPLTVSPFISLPTATSLPYTFKPLRPTLPPSVTDQAHSSNQATQSSFQERQVQQTAAYVVSSSTGHAAHPDQIIASCQALQAHLTKLQEDAREVVRRWQDSIMEKELMEKRRVAPGWLDVDQRGRMLVPERVGGATHAEAAQISSKEKEGVELHDRSDGGEELDRAFGRMELR